MFILLNILDVLPRAPLVVVLYPLCESPRAQPVDLHLMLHKRRATTAVILVKFRKNHILNQSNVQPGFSFICTWATKFVVLVPFCIIMLMRMTMIKKATTMMMLIKNTMTMIVIMMVFMKKMTTVMMMIIINNSRNRNFYYYQIAFDSFFHVYPLRGDFPYWRSVSSKVDLIDPRRYGRVFM